MTLDQLVTAYRTFYGSYHNHKEQMAYGATVLYVSAATAVTLTGPSIWKYPTPNWLTSILLIATAVIAFLFVGWQLRKREFAADMVAACTTLAAWSVSFPLANPDVSTVREDLLDFPAVLKDQLVQARKARGWAGGPRQSEYVTHGVMAVWTIAALISVWPLRLA